ncbi:hypothetical protein LINGRAHAP2_LOCUS31330 [Linum grandiflorum]
MLLTSTIRHALVDIGVYLGSHVYMQLQLVVTTGKTSTTSPQNITHYTLLKRHMVIGGIPALPGQQAWEEAEGTVIHPPRTRILPGRPKKNLRKEHQELEVKPAKSGVGKVVGRKGIVMHCRTCHAAGHNSRNCPDKLLPPVVGQGEGSRSRRRARNRSPEVQSRNPKRTVHCGKCGVAGHNTRRCPRLRGVQADIHPNTSGQVQTREMRATMQGVGVYIAPSTGNTYYRSLLRVGPSRVEVQDIRNSQPPQTQGSE